MANVKITELPAAIAAALTQTLEVVTDPSGTPVSEKITVTQLSLLLGSVTIKFTNTDPALPTTPPVNPTMNQLRVNTSNGKVWFWNAITQSWPVVVQGSVTI